MFLGDLHIVKGLDPVADALSGTVTSAIVNMKHFDQLLYLLHKGVGATGTSTITVEACSDTSATATTAIPFQYKSVTSGDTQGNTTVATASGFTLTAGSSQAYAILVNEAELGDTGYSYVRLKATEVVDSPVLASISILGTAKRYSDVTTALT